MLRNFFRSAWRRCQYSSGNSIVVMRRPVVPMCLSRSASDGPETSQDGKSVPHRSAPGTGKAGVTSARVGSREGGPLSFWLRDDEQNDTDNLITDMVDCTEGLWRIVFSAVLTLTGVSKMRSLSIDISSGITREIPVKSLSNCIQTTTH